MPICAYNTARDCVGYRMKRKKNKGTIQISQLLEYGMVLCILLLFPLNLSGVYSEKEDTEELFSSGVEWEVLHRLAQTIPISYEKETLKAQAVILRTNILAQKERGEKDKESVPLLFSYKNKWGSEYEENCKKIFEAVEETEGLFLERERKPFSVPFFSLSNGQTRAGGECLGEKYEIFQKKECKKDLLSENFLQTTYIKGEVFAKKVSSFWGEEYTFGKVREMDIIYERDTSGYVRWVEFDGKRIGGEVFRQMFSLPSSDFYVKFEKNKVSIETKGEGTGIGFCQYSANEMAKEGKDFFELLSFFFTNIAITKTE